MSFIIVPDRIKRMERQIKPWEIGAGIFKEGTPKEILEMDKEVMDFYDNVMDGFQ